MHQDTVVFRRRRRHATAASRDFFCVPFGGRANRRVSTPPTCPLRRSRPGAKNADFTYGSNCEDCGPPACRPPSPMTICIKHCMIGMSSHASDGDCDGGPGVRQWLRRIRPALPPHPPICAETPRTTQGVSQVLNLGFRRRLRGRWPRLGVRPASGHVGLTWGNSGPDQFSNM